MNIFRKAIRKPQRGDVEQVLSTAPAYPGVALHVCVVDATPDQVEQCQQELSFPVHIHNTVSSRASQERETEQDESGWVVGQKHKGREKNGSVRIKSLLPTMEAACTSVQGERSHMEDRFALFLPRDLVSALGPLPVAEGVLSAYFGVFDGHAGERAANICTERFHCALLEHECFATESSSVGGEDMLSRLQAAITGLDEEIVKQGLEEGWADGSCLSVAVVVGSTLYTANLGDSHMVLGAGGGQERPASAVVLTATHKAAEASEKQRIVSVGGMVMRGRVFGDLAISRAMGDLNYKKPKQEDNFVSNEAHCKRTLLDSDEHHLLIIASDGLWDKISPEEAIGICTRTRQEGKSADAASKALIDEAAARNSLDNTTALVVFFDWVTREQYLAEVADISGEKAAEKEASNDQEELRDKEARQGSDESYSSVSSYNSDDEESVG